MDDAAFIAYILNNSARYELETLEEIVKSLNHQIASRRWGKPVDLEIGSHVEATMFGGSYAIYGTVTRLTPQGCVLEQHGLEYPQRIAYSKYAVRVVPEIEWNRITYSINARRKEFETEIAADHSERVRDREAAIAERLRNAKKPKVMQALNGPVDIYRGAYVHAYRPDHGHHEYGVVVEITPKS